MKVTAKHKPRLTREMAYAAGQDMGNRSMRKAGRKAWNVEDFIKAATEANRLLDIIERERQ